MSKIDSFLKKQCIQMCLISETVNKYNNLTDAYKQAKLQYLNHSNDDIRQTTQEIVHFIDWQYLIFPVGWFAESLENVEQIIDGFKEIAASEGKIIETHFCYAKMCAGAVLLAKNGASKREVYEYISRRYNENILKESDLFPKKTPKAKEYGIFNFTSDNIPLRINQYAHTSSLTENLLAFFENDSLKNILKGLMHNMIAWSIGVAYYGVNGSFNNCCLRAFPELTDKLFSSLLEYKPTPNKEADEQWLAEYREKATNRQTTEADEPFKEPSKLSIYMGTFLQLANYNSDNTHRGVGVPVWSIIVYIALMLAVSIMKFNWVGWIFITLIFMSFVWKE